MSSTGDDARADESAVMLDDAVLYVLSFADLGVHYGGKPPFHDLIAALGMSAHDATGILRTLRTLADAVNRQDYNRFGQSRMQLLRYVRDVQHGRAGSSGTISGEGTGSGSGSGSGSVSGSAVAIQEVSQRRGADGTRLAVFSAGVTNMLRMSMQDVKRHLGETEMQPPSLASTADADVAVAQTSFTNASSRVDAARSVRKRSRPAARPPAIETLASPDVLERSEPAARRADLVAELRSICNSSPAAYRSSWTRLLYLADRLHLRPPPGSQWRKETLCGAIAERAGVAAADVVVASQLDPRLKSVDQAFMSDPQQWPSEMYDPVAQSVMTMPYSYEAYDESSGTALTGHAEPSTLLGMLESGRTLYDVAGGRRRWTAKQVARDEAIDRAIRTHVMTAYGMRLPPVSDAELEAAHQLKSRGYTRREQRQTAVFTLGGESAPATSSPLFVVDDQDVLNHIRDSIVQFARSVGFSSVFAHRVLRELERRGISVAGQVAYAVRDAGDYETLRQAWARTLRPYASARQRNRDVERLNTLIEALVRRPLSSEAALRLAGAAEWSAPLPAPLSVRSRLMAESLAEIGAGRMDRALEIVNVADEASSVSL